MYLEKSTPIALTQLDIANKRLAAATADAICEVIRQFDGKVYNVKFERAIEAKTGMRFYTGLYRYNTDCLNIELYLDKVTVPDGEFSVSYTQNRTIYFTYPDEKTPTLNGKRINADALCGQIEKRKQELLDEADELERNLNKVDELIKTVDTLNKQLRDYIKSIPYEIRDYFNIGIKLLDSYL